MARISTEEKIGLLWDYAVARPDGFTRYDIEGDLGWDNVELYRVARHLRAAFADDTINLVCEPGGYRAAWTYRLVGTLDDARVWATNRHGDLVTRLETVKAVAGTIENATDGRTLEGRKARKVHRTLGYLLAELGEMDGVA